MIGMSLRSLWQTALILAKEQIYQGRKEGYGSGGMNRSATQHLIVTNLSLLPLFVLLPSFLGAIQATTASAAVGMFTTLLLVQLLFSIVMTLGRFSSFKNLELQKPLLSLPLPEKPSIISLSWLLTGNIPLVFVSFFGAAFYAFRTGDWSSLPLGLFWGIFTVLIGHSIGLILSSKFSVGFSRNSRFGKMIQSLKIVGLIAFLFGWYFLSVGNISTGQYLEPLSGVGPLAWFVFPFSAAKSIVDFSAVHLFSMVGYGILFSGIFRIVSKWAWEDLKEPTHAVSQRIKEFEMKLRSRLVASVRKDLVMLFRRGQKIFSVVLFPLMALFPLLINVIQGGEAAFYSSELSYLAAGIVCSLGTIYLYVQEGKSAWIVSTLPTKEEEFAFQKASSITAIFPVYAVPVIVAVSLLMGYGPAVLLLQVLSSAFMAFTSSLIASNSLIGRLPDNPSVITQDSFGYLTTIIVLLKTALLSGWVIPIPPLVYVIVRGTFAGLMSSAFLLLLTVLLVFLNTLFTVWRYNSFAFFES